MSSCVVSQEKKLKKVNCAFNAKSVKLQIVCNDKTLVFPSFFLSKSLFLRGKAKTILKEK